ncbi:NAD(P)H-dependent oxidoreductase subunit E [bacterium]|nr:MAG: NAD(P)H-dependent oxidoreductase subunit E [bacterium]
MDSMEIDTILEKYRYRHSDIIGILQDAQAIENYLPEESLRYISEKMEISLTRIFDIVTFYKAFSLVPRGKHTVRVCCGTACHLGGAQQSLEQLNRLLQIQDGETTDDRLFSLETVNCLGACALAPVVAVDEDYHEAVNAGKIEKMLETYREEG